MSSSDKHDALIRAVMAAQADNSPAAHALLDGRDDDPTACWIRACLHKRAGDEATARQWYRRSGQFYESYSDADTELAAIKAALTY